jgi:hypothetical protein
MSDQERLNRLLAEAAETRARAAAAIEKARQIVSESKAVRRPAPPERRGASQKD